MSGDMGFEKLAALNIFDGGDAFDGADSFVDGERGMMTADDGPALMLDEGGGGGLNVTPNRTDHFSLATGQFRDPATGEFEPGGAPPDADLRVDRYRSSVTGRFKESPADHFDEPAEVRLGSLEPKG